MTATARSTGRPCELILLTDLLTANLDNPGYNWTRPPAAPPDRTWLRDEEAAIGRHGGTAGDPRAIADSRPRSPPGHWQNSVGIAQPAEEKAPAG
jgi:hypothetical protein